MKTKEGISPKDESSKEEDMKSCGNPQDVDTQSIAAPPIVEVQESNSTDLDAKSKESGSTKKSSKGYGKTPE